MGEVVFVEILDRLGHVKERVRLNSLPASVGRAYTNDVILDDRYVCPVHLRIVRDSQGRVVAEDAGSVNGLFSVSPHRRAERIVVSPEGRVRVGSTVLQFRTPGSRVAPTERLNGRAVSSHPAVSLLLFGLSVMLILLMSVLESYEPFALSEFLSEALLLVLLFVTWAGVWAFANRLITHAFRFLAHLSVGSAMVALSAVFDTVVDYADYFLSPQPAALDTVRFAGFGLMGALMLFVHLSVVGAPKPMPRFAAAVIVSAAVFGVLGYKTYDDHTGFSNELSFSAELKPVGGPLIRTVTPDEFFRNVKSLKSAVDSEVGDGDVHDEAAPETDNQRNTAPPAPDRAG
ncbi:MAG: hypothetical protein OHK006_03150 [Thermodesulfovibrionales bacterium]